MGPLGQNPTPKIQRGWPIPLVVILMAVILIAIICFLAVTEFFDPDAH